MKQNTEKIVISLFFIVVLIWGGYHFVQYSQNDIKTEAALELPADNTLAGIGVVFRTEEVLPQNQSGIMNYIHQDATKISIDDTIAEFYSSNIDDSSIWRMRELSTEIDMLKYASNKNINNFSSTNVINRDIREQLDELNIMTNSGRFLSLENTRNELTSLINRRQIATGNELSFQQRIAELEQEYATLESRTHAENVQQVTAPVSGYFSKEVDGYESKLTPEHLATMKIDDFLQYVQDKPTAKPNYIGKMVTSHKWNMAVTIPAHDIEGVRTGASVSIILDDVEEPIPAKIIEVLHENLNDVAVILLSCEIMTENVINLRVTDVLISFGHYSGLKIDTKSLRFVTNDDGETVRGVFVLENHVIKFKTIDPVYEDVDYILSRINSGEAGSENNVQLFDQVIVSGGTDLYDGKPTQ